MNAVPSTGMRTDSRLLTVAILGVAGLLAARFLARDAWHYTTYSLAAFTEYYWPRRAGLIVHVLGGSLAITTGIAQLWLGLTQRTAGIHKVLGKVYASAILFGAGGAFYMALTIPGEQSVYGLGLFMLAVAWVVTTSMAIVAIRRRDVQQHRDWMIRSYTVTFAFATFRLGADVLTQRHWLSEDAAQSLMAWACWSVPPLLVEPLLQLRRMRRA